MWCGGYATVRLIIKKCDDHVFIGLIVECHVFHGTTIFYVLGLIVGQYMFCDTR